ncbi:alpha-phosphoglucomutase [Bacillus sp. 349Y]|nr:alpha-phosphoglucomutase [Bacillus sp. 349Y]
MRIKEKFEQWINYAELDLELKQQLEQIRNQPQEIENMFYKYLEFGTGGIRGELGPGTNRLNIYMIRKSTEGLARYIEIKGEHALKRGVVIAYDSRHKSYEFALEVAKTLGHHRIKSFLFESLRPTPVLSFAVRELGAYAGIVITASHNPPEYNGFKVYGPDGGQITPLMADEIIKHVDSVEEELFIEVSTEESLLSSGLLEYIGKEVDDAYQENLISIRQNHLNINSVADTMKIVFTPLHGTSNIPVRRGLQSFGFKHVYVVKEQELPDPNFSTIESPNPEEHAAFKLAIEYGEKIGADILLGTDPDTDRLGVVARNNRGEYQVLTGNQMGAIMLHYILNQKKSNGTLPTNGIVLKTIVTSELGRIIARSFGVETIDTLTGFKYIGEKIQEYSRTGEYKFIFGYEESYGYLIDEFVRDKDAIQASVLAAEVAAYYKAQGKTLYDGLNEIFQQYGYYQEGLKSITLKGRSGAEIISNILSRFRSAPPNKIGGLTLKLIEDYQLSERINCVDQTRELILLPKSNVLKYYLSDGSWFCVRPSGTEPKVKFYFGVKDISVDEACEKLLKVENDLMEFVNNIIDHS